MQNKKGESYEIILYFPKSFQLRSKIVPTFFQHGAKNRRVSQRACSNNYNVQIKSLVTKEKNYLRIKTYNPKYVNKIQIKNL